MLKILRFILPAILLIATLHASVVIQPSKPVNAVLGASEYFAKGQKFYEKHEYEQALVFFRQAADLGSPEAQYMTALMLYRGEGSRTADSLGAARYYTLAARNNFPKAQYNLAILYYEGTGVARDDIEAYKWLYLATLRGEPRALDMLPVADRNLGADQKAQAISEAHNLTVAGNS